MADLYANYAALSAAETEGVDYTRSTSYIPDATWSSIAIHGGGIEAGSGEMATAVGAGLMSTYVFAGIKSSGNTDLHITSTNFDEPMGVALVASTTKTLSFHGMSGATAQTAIGGKDTATVALLTTRLTEAGFTVITAASEIAGEITGNICNSNKSGAGVQLEMSLAQRQAFFPGGDTSRTMRESGQRTDEFYKYAAAMRSVLPTLMFSSTGLPKVRIEVGFTSPYVGDFFSIGDPIRGKIGGSPIGAEEIWSDISPWVRSWSVRRGTSSGNAPSRRYDPGTATVILNDGDRRFDPDNLAGPYVSSGVTQIESMRRVRIIAEWGTAAYPLFSGYADDWAPDYQGNFWTYTTLTATDASKILVANIRTATVPSGGNELSGARITRILDGIVWPAEDRVLDAGETLLQPTDLSGDPLTELQLVQDTELGELFLDSLGRIQFQDRNRILINSRSRDSQATFGDGGYAVTGEIPYANVILSTSDDGLANQVTVTRAGGTAQTAVDSLSIASYLTHSFEQSELMMASDADALDHATAILYQNSMPQRRVSRVEFVRPTPVAEQAAWPAILDREFGDRITVLRRPAGGGEPIQRAAFVRGIEHSSDGQFWNTAFICQAADKYSFFTIGHAELGKVGVHPIAF